MTNAFPAAATRTTFASCIFIERDTGKEVIEIDDYKVAKKFQAKDRLQDMTEEEMFDLLASDGLLVKRPIAVIGDCDKVLVGFKESEWADITQ